MDVTDKNAQTRKPNITIIMTSDSIPMSPHSITNQSIKSADLPIGDRAMYT